MVVLNVSINCSTAFFINMSMLVKVSTRRLHSWPTLQAAFLFPVKKKKNDYKNVKK